MISLQELCAYLNNLLQPTPINDYCFNGLQVEGRKQIHRLATGVSANLETIQAAALWNADVLLVHHGLFWNQDPYQIQGIKREKLGVLFKNDISLIAYHLPLDAHQEVGNNWKAALDLGWKDLQPFCFSNGIFLGVKGRFKEMTREDFQKKLEDYYQHPAQSAPGGKEKIQTVGLVSGGGYKFISHAIRDNLDVFITGNFDEPVWHQAFEEKINFFAMGHSATEKIGPKALGELVSQEFSLDYQFIDSYNPF